MSSTIEERLKILEDRIGDIEMAIGRSRRLWFAVSIGEARARLATPVEYGPEELERFRQFYGSIEGPEDLSEHM